MENCTIQNRKIENMKALMMQLACSDPSRLPYDDMIEEKIQMLMMRSLPDHPTYAAMIIGALQLLKEEEGSTEEAISSFIAKCYDDLPLAHATFLKHHLKQLVQKEEIFRISGNRYLLIGSMARTDLKESQKPKSEPQVEQIEGQKQDFNAKGSAEVNKESPGEEQTNYAIDNQTEEQPGSTEECDKELRANTDKIVVQTDPGKRMADELTNDKGQHRNRVIRQQICSLQNPKEAIAAKQEQSRPTCAADEVLPSGEEIMQASDEQDHPEQHVDYIGYRNQLQGLKKLQEQQSNFYDKIIELHTIVENLKKSEKVVDPRKISSSSALTDLGVDQSCSLLFSTEEGLQLLQKVSGINHQLAEILNSSSLLEASNLASESVVRGQQTDLSANHLLPTTASCQGPHCKSHQEKSPSKVSDSKRHLDSKSKPVNTFKSRKKTKLNAELLVETSVGGSDQAKLVDQLGGDAVVPSTTGRPETEEHLNDTETSERVTTRMQKKRSGVFKEPATTLVSEQLHHQQQQVRKVSVPYSQRKRVPDSAAEDSLCLKDFFALERAKMDTKMKMKPLDREQQQEEHETPDGEADPQACSELLGEKSFEEQKKKRQMKRGLQQQRLLRSRAKRPSDSGAAEDIASAETTTITSQKTTESAGVSSPDKDNEEPGSPPTKPKLRGRPPGSLKVLKLHKKVQKQLHPKRPRGRPCKIKVPTDTSTNELCSNKAEESEPQGKESVTDIDKGTLEPENPEPEEPGGETDADHLQGKDIITSSTEQRLQTIKSSEGRITRSKLAGP